MTTELQQAPVMDIHYKALAVDFLSCAARGQQSSCDYLKVAASYMVEAYLSAKR